MIARWIVVVFSGDACKFCMKCDSKEDALKWRELYREENPGTNPLVYQLVP